MRPIFLVTIVVLIVGLAAAIVLRSAGPDADSSMESATTASEKSAEIVQSAPAPRSQTPSESGAQNKEVGSIVPSIESVLKLPNAMAVVDATGLRMGNADLREARQATLMACYQAMSWKPRGMATAEQERVVSEYRTQYCQGVDAQILERDRAGGWLQADPLQDAGSEQAKAAALLEELMKDGPDKALLGPLLDLLVNTPYPIVAQTFAAQLLNPEGVFYGELQTAKELRFMPKGRVDTVMLAVGDLLACGNGPLCAPSRAYTMTLCMRSLNCVAGANLLQIRADLTAPYDWRLAQAITVEIRQRQSSQQRGGG